MTDQKNPYRDYQVSHLYEYLSRASVGFPPGTGAAYSNLGAGLLGHVLALRAGLPYEELLAERILRPLGLADTGVALSADQASRLAPGHDAMGNRPPTGTSRRWPGPGRSRSTADEMLSFLRANLDPPGTPAGAALRACHAPRPVAWWRRVGVGISQGLGLAAASLLVQWAVPLSPGRWTFLAALIVPVLVALGMEGLLVGGVDGGRGVGRDLAALGLGLRLGAGRRGPAHLPRGLRARRRLPPAGAARCGWDGRRPRRARACGPLAQRGDRGLPQLRGVRARLPGRRRRPVQLG